MCGICGFIDYKFQNDDDIFSKMVSSLHHRGPDDRGFKNYSTDIALTGLGHTRLSVLDLSSAGHQPMSYKDISMVFNGEIYNFIEIRQELNNLGHTFISESDTEVALHAFSEWGIKCVSKFIGMFVMAILNRASNEMTLIRDRAGIKPLYYYWRDDLFLFASELKAFHQHPRFKKTIKVSAVHQFMDFGYVPSPHCIFENCAKLEPGHILTFKINTRAFEISKYWHVKDYYCLPDLEISYDEAKDELEKLLISAFEYRMVSDVPVGVFLSGGYDSTAVASILQSRRSRKLKTFTIGFNEGNNEAPFAKNIARYIGTDHTEYYCSTKEAQDIIPVLPYYYDEPFADSSAIPTILVSRIAKKQVKVALSADAGDEIFAGYTSYKTFISNLALIRKIPTHLKKYVNALATASNICIPNNNQNFKHKMETFCEILNTDVTRIPQTLLKGYVSLSASIKNELFLENTSDTYAIYDENFSNLKDSLSIPLAIDYITYLQNDILTKVDRATMSVSLEGREPFLDHRIVEFVAQLPSYYKYGSTQKMILKDIVHKYVPKKLLDRPKSGFSLPINSWLRTDLSYLLEEYLDSESITETALFKPEYIQKLHRDFVNNKRVNSTIIWKLLQFQMWFKEWMN